MKLYQVKTKDNKLVKFALYADDRPKEHLTDYVSYQSFDFRTLKEISFPKGRFEVTDLDTVHYIFYNGENIVAWDDNAVVYYPEDLCWNRDIGDLIAQVEKLKELEFKDREQK